MLFTLAYTKRFTSGTPATYQAESMRTTTQRTKGWTKRFQPWRLTHSESFTTKEEAMKREQELKTHQGRDFIRKLI